uniref:ATP synthase F0 subunit 8 n=1 Tax=Songthela hangzhouensis TaxID=1649374 RepID=Q6JT42_9ARAC|nr:ATP synthase F0 subunit 8 [Songthela hangzhouensis]AAP51136.1 ATP synthase F0 subunit 8 [Songthela hangzhouensis]
MPQTAPLYWFMSPIFILTIIVILIYNHYLYYFSLLSNKNYKSFHSIWSW